MATQVSLRSKDGHEPSGERIIFRRWQRFRLNLPTRLIHQGDESTRIFEGRVQDISEGGVLVFAGVELRSGDKVSLEITLPYSSQPVRAPGMVRHRRGYNYGVEFLAETRVEQEQIATFRGFLQLAAHNSR